MKNQRKADHSIRTIYPYACQKYWRGMLKQSMERQERQKFIDEFEEDKNEQP